jgi:glycolate oxidase
MVMRGGEVIRLCGRQLDSAGIDLLGVVVGSEGLLGVMTEVTVRILPKPQDARAMLGRKLINRLELPAVG